MHLFLRGLYTLNWNAACVSVGLSAENVLFAHVRRGGNLMLSDFFRHLLDAANCLRYVLLRESAVTYPRVCYAGRCVILHE